MDAFMRDQTNHSIGHVIDCRPAWNKCLLNHCLESITSFNTHLSNSRQCFNVHLILLCSHPNRPQLRVMPVICLSQRGSYSKKGQKSQMDVKVPQISNNLCASFQLKGQCHWKQGSHSFTDKKSRTFQDPMKNFPGL